MAVGSIDAYFAQIVNLKKSVVSRVIIPSSLQQPHARNMSTPPFSVYTSPMHLFGARSLLLAGLLDALGARVQRALLATGLGCHLLARLLLCCDSQLSVTSQITEPHVCCTGEVWCIGRGREGGRQEEGGKGWTTHRLAAWPCARGRPRRAPWWPFWLFCCGSGWSRLQHTSGVSKEFFCFFFF